MEGPCAASTTLLPPRAPLPQATTFPTNSCRHRLLRHVASHLPSVPRDARNASHNSQLWQAFLALTTHAHKNACWTRYVRQDHRPQTATFPTNSCCYRPPQQVTPHVPPGPKNAHETSKCASPASHPRPVHIAPKRPSRLTHARLATPKSTNCQNRTPRATLPTVPLHRTTLAHSTITPTQARTTASASTSTASSDALPAPSRRNRQERLVLLRFALSPAHSAPLRCITAAHWESL